MRKGGEDGRLGKSSVGGGNSSALSLPERGEFHKGVCPLAPKPWELLETGGEKGQKGPQCWPVVELPGPRVPGAQDARPGPVPSMFHSSLPFE